ncbi:MAG: hypothetical protein ACOYBY_18645, partial [Dermatophilaceae bacterium]
MNGFRVLAEGSESPTLGVVHHFFAALADPATLLLGLYGGRLARSSGSDPIGRLLRRGRRRELGWLGVQDPHRRVIHRRGPGRRRRYVGRRLVDGRRILMLLGWFLISAGDLSCHRGGGRLIQGGNLRGFSLILVARFRNQAQTSPSRDVFTVEIHAA